MPLYELDAQRPTLGTGAWVAPTADLIAEVVLGDEASVWFGAVIRADNTAIRIGDRNNVQEGAMLHSDPGTPLTVGADCTIGHHATLHGCTIADRVLVGMGAIVPNRAAIAEECIVGAGALVTEGKSFLAGSLIVGSPARVMRPLAESERAMLRISAQHYVAKANACTGGLRRVD